MRLSEQNIINYKQKIHNKVLEFFSCLFFDGTLESSMCIKLEKDKHF